MAMHIFQHRDGALWLFRYFVIFQDIFMDSVERRIKSWLICHLVYFPFVTFEMLLLCQSYVHVYKSGFLI